MKLFTETYRNQISQMKKWGGNGWKWGNAVVKLIIRHNIRTALDYGCGQGSLRKKVVESFIQPQRHKCKYSDYDPAQRHCAPAPAELVTCTDVLEHVEPEFIDNVIRHLLILTEKVCFVVIALKEAERTLPDGRGAHLIVENAGWWMEKICKQMSHHNKFVNVGIPFNSIERISSSRLDNDKQLILVIRRVGKEEALDKE